MRLALIALNLFQQIVAAIMAITGIVMMAYADGFHGDSFVGVALAVGSASTSALYKVRQPKKYMAELLWLFLLRKNVGYKFLIIVSPARCCSRCSLAAPTWEK